jgi:molecular chaperone DnaK
VAKKDQPFVGIDLGTTNSVVAYIDEADRPVTIPNSEGDILTPSVVYFEPEGPAIVGKEAVKAGLLDPANVAEAVKRDMGREFYRRPIRGKHLPPAAISGVILNRLVKDARERLGNFDRAVVTVPAYFNEPRRKATMDAARMAGLKEVELLNEPTAAALAFGYELGVFNEKGGLADVATKVPGRYSLLVYDLGGGTFDVTLMRIEDKHFRALVCDGDVQLGGRDWDERVVRYAAECFQRETGVDLTADAEATAALWVQAEEAKRALTQRTQTVLRVSHAGKRVAIELTREDLLSLTADLLGRTRLTCELAVQEAHVKWDLIDAVLLVGGSSRMPMVSEMLQEISGRPPNRSVSPDEAVAQGAALYAQMVWGEDAELKESVRRPSTAKITNVNAHSLGIVGFDPKIGDRRVSVLIPKNSPIPKSNTKTFRTRRAGQELIYIQIVEGESSHPDRCTLIGECKLKGLPKDLPPEWPVHVTFAYRRDGRVFVEAQVEGAEPFHVEIDRNRRVSREDAEAWASELLSVEPGERPSKPPVKVVEKKLKPKSI